MAKTVTLTYTQGILYPFHVDYYVDGVRTGNMNHRLLIWGGPNNITKGSVYETHDEDDFDSNYSEQPGTWYACVRTLVEPWNVNSAWVESNTITYTVESTQPHPYTITFTCNPTTLTAGQSTQFQSLTTYDNETFTPSSYSWNFGDGTTSTDPYPTHAYATNGSYTVTFNCPFPDGQTHTAIRVITVGSAPPSSGVIAKWLFKSADGDSNSYVQDVSGHGFHLYGNGSLTDNGWQLGNAQTSQSIPVHNLTTRTIKARIYFSSNPVYEGGIFGNGNNQDYDYGVGCWHHNQTDQLLFTIGLPGTAIIDWPWSLTGSYVGQVVEIIWTRQDRHYELWINGTKVTEGEGTTDESEFNKVWKIGKLDGTDLTYSAAYMQYLEILDYYDVDPVDPTPTAPTANFTISPTSPTTRDTIYLTNTSAGSGLTYAWNLGVAGSATSKDVPVGAAAFGGPGTYPITLTVTNSAGSSTITKSVTITYVAPPGPTPPYADFEFSPNPANLTGKINFSDTSLGRPTSWLWNMGEAGTYTTQNPEINAMAFGGIGTFPVKLTVSNADGSNTITKNVTITYQGTDSVNFTWAPEPQCVGYPVQFSGLSNLPVQTWKWDFGDGSCNLPVLSSPLWSFRHFGYGPIYPTTDPQFGNTIYDCDNGASIVYSSPHVIPAGTIIILTARHPTNAGGEFTFNVTNLQGSGTYIYHQKIARNEANYRDYSFTVPADTMGFDFFIRSDHFYIKSITYLNGGGGNFSSEQNPKHAYTAAGQYLVTLTIDTGSQIASISHTVTITGTCKCFADFTWAPASSRVGAEVSFTDTSTHVPFNPITSWSWDFGDSTGSTAQNPKHTYSTSGTKTVKLTISDGVNTDTITHQIVVKPGAIVAEFEYPQLVAKNSPFSLTNKSTNATSYSWQFPDNTTSTDINPTHTFTTSGHKEITLTASNEYENASVTHTVLVTGDIYIPPIVFNWTGYVPPTAKIQLCGSVGGLAGGLDWPIENFGPFTFNWNGNGKIMLCGSADATGLIMVDDWYSLTVNGTARDEEMARPFNGVWQPGRDVTYLFTVGANTVTFRTWSTICCYYGHSEFWLVQVTE